ncbi:DegT/DnrJ/EryC1/StrS family aminotransferase [Nocardioides sp. R1-1]|uniref:DegT/DnrJ/EryC1/StrS family aminotransferase n=1 Tax=Nocardioides sp. R1-1 TaxID=3383502 RepID=UPI0038D0E313
MTTAHPVLSPLPSADGAGDAPARILLSGPDVGAEERAALLRAFDSGWIAPLGPEVDAFERELAEATGRAHAVALASGSAALHLALLELGVGPGDEVVAPTFTFAATVNPIRYLGATPVLVDAEPRTWGMDPGLLEEELGRRARTGRLPRAVVVVDLFGQPCDHDALRSVAASYDVALVEDAAEALGAVAASGAPAGSLGESAIVSFNGNKMITTSGGGVLVTDEADVAERARSRASQSRLPVPHYEHAEIGYNYRLSNLLAALGRAQLARLTVKVARRREIAARYRARLADLPGLSFAPYDTLGTSNGWLSVVVLDPSSTPGSDSLRRALAAEGIESRPVWKPMHRQPVFADVPTVLNGVADCAFSRGLCLPSGSALSDAEVDRVIDAVRRGCGAWS